LEKQARSTLLFNELYGSGVQVYAGAPPPPDNSHMSRAQALSVKWAPGSVPQLFYSELAKAQRVPLPSPLRSHPMGKLLGMLLREVFWR